MKQLEALSLKSYLGRENYELSTDKGENSSILVLLRYHFRRRQIPSPELLKAALSSPILNKAEPLNLCTQYHDSWHTPWVCHLGSAFPTEGPLLATYSRWWLHSRPQVALPSLPVTEGKGLSERKTQRPKVYGLFLIILGSRGRNELCLLVRDKISTIFGPHQHWIGGLTSSLRVLFIYFIPTVLKLVELYSPWVWFISMCRFFYLLTLDF